MRRTASIAAAGLLLTVLFGCARTPVSFELLLAKIDAQGSLASAESFKGAVALAATSSDKLRLLKRTRYLNPGEAVEVADWIMKSGATAAVGLAVLDIFLNNSAYRSALELFAASLPPAEYPLEFAEAYSRARLGESDLALPLIERSWLLRAYEATGRAEFLYEAILQALEDGDIGSARVLLNEYLSMGLADMVRPSTSLLWQYGFFDLILAFGPSNAQYEDLAAYGDAALQSGNRALATAVYSELLERYPSRSWKPYAALAWIAEQGPHQESSMPLPLATVPVARNPESGYWYALMMDRFPDEYYAALEYGLWLYRQGASDAADSLLAKASLSLGAEGKATARLALSGTELRPIVAIELASSYPASSAVQDSVLAALFISGSWKRFLSVNRERVVPVDREWFWDTVSLTLAGDFDAAHDYLRVNGPKVPGFEVPYTLALLEYATGGYKKASESFMLAAGDADSSATKARCMVWAGDSLAEAGESESAVAAYSAALSLDMFNNEAMAALRRLSPR